MLLGEPRQCCDHLWRQRPGAAHIDIEAVQGRGDLDVERLADPDQGFGERPGRVERAVETGIEDRAAIDRHDVVRIGSSEPDLEHVVRAEPRMQGHAAAASAMRIDQLRDVAIELRLPQRLDDEVAFPDAIAILLPVLDRAAAAHREVRAERRDALTTCGLDRQKMPAVGMARDALNLDGLAAERIGHVDANPIGEGHAVAAMADMIDEKPFNHVARRGKIRHCRRRR